MTSTNFASELPVDSSAPIHLRRGGTSLVVDTSTPGLPTIIHWGIDLGELNEIQLHSMARAAQPQRVSGGIDIPARLTVLPQEAFGWQGSPALIGQRSGRDWVSALSLTQVEVSEDALRVTSEDSLAKLMLVCELKLTAHGVVVQRHTLSNLGDNEYQLSQLATTFPLPVTATTILDSTGRHLKERSQQRRELTVGAHVRESRRGRPGADSSLLVLAGSTGFNHRQGIVHGVHLAWSGNHRLTAEKTITGMGFLSAGELLLPGEVVLAPGESYSTPWAYGSWGDGLDELAARFHQDLRARSQHPVKPRPVTLNTWEAVYFDHDLQTLTSLAEKAASVGVERFVLDDGWFKGRRDDTAGLGDWFVDETVWPSGLSPIIDHVQNLGMEFGLWFEPEMVNLDSDLARSHSEWILHVEGRWPVSARQQQVLNLANPDCFAYVLGRLDAMLSEYPIDYIKWDHNRDLLEASDQLTGRARVHEATLALYRLLAELKTRHPRVEIESCASGGARVDLGILEHTDRIWASDCIDPIERLDNQEFTSLLVPYELIGAHIGGPRSHSTARQHTLGFMARTAMFGHFGIEWNIAEISAEQSTELASWIDFHKKHRNLFHTGTSIHADHPDPAVDLRGVVSQDQQSAVFALTQREASITYPGGNFTVPGLDPQRNYSVTLSHPLEEGTEQLGNGQSPLSWSLEPVELTGLTLAAVGLQRPVLFPEQAVLIVISSADE